MTDDAHRSIGEVLSLLREEFPDVTISKIRFLESQGLIGPERTPSGYRKFYDTDLQRLRWILQQQRENYLPLKVIRGKLEQLQLGDGALLVDDEPEPAPSPEPQPAAAASKSRSRAKSKANPKANPKAQPRRRAPSKKAPAPTPVPSPTPVELDDGPDDDLIADTSGVSLTRVELARAAGLDDDALAQLEEFGLLEPSRLAGGHALFDDDALAVAGLAAGMLRHGIEARHLRMYRQFAEREALLFEQVLLPVLRQRNPEARAKAREALVELARLGRGLRNVYLRRAAGRVLAE